MIPAPPRLSISDHRGQAIRTLRERCLTLGVATWRCDNAGLIVSDPEQGAPVGLLWGSRAIAGLISGAVRDANSGPDAGERPRIVELFTGCWAVLLPERRRRDRTGWLVGLALSVEGLNARAFEEACLSAALDVHAMRRVLTPHARYTRASMDALRDAMLWMVQDLLHVEESDQTVSGFTRQLSDCFETIDLLYALGRSMNELTHPGQFVEHLCRRVRDTLNFGFVGAYFLPGSAPGADVDGALIVQGETRLRPLLEAELKNVLAGIDPDSGRVLINELGGKPLPGAGQVLMHPVLRAGRPIGLLFSGDKHGDDPQVSSYDIQLMEAAAGYAGAFIDNAVLYAEQKALSLGTLETLSAAIDAKDRYTCGHSQRVALLSKQLALAAGMDEDQAERVRVAGLVHDIGKIGVPENVLTKSGKLTDDEFDAIKKHPEIGHRILKDLPLMSDVLPGVLHHHERWDGRGYPHRIAGESIPLQARIIALADTFDAMSSNRSYRSAMPRAQVLVEIQKCSGAQFDPALAKLFITLDLSEYDRMVNLHQTTENAAATAA
ncbi:MAG: HD-GYP domain-containing protein [Phycisphaerales bacterium]|nr:HD-GYP domain-containing protein [Phycisphaerales bacterium]